MMKKLFPLLLCMIMLVSAFAVSASAAGNEPNLTVDISKTEVVENDEVVVTIGIKEMKAASVLFTLDFDTDMLTVSSITAKRNAKLDYYAYDPDADEWYEDQLGATTISTKAEAASGHIGVAFANDTEVLYYEKSDVVVVKFIANKAGAIEFEIYESSSGTDGYKGTWIEPPQAPACEHTETKLVPNADKTHNVVCANTECGEIVKANETCIAQANSHNCVCGNVVSVCDDKDGDGNHACDICGAANITAHKGGTADCKTGAICSECNTEYTAKDANNHAGDIYPVSNSNKTHNKMCRACGTAVVTNEACTDTNGDKVCDVCSYFPVCEHDGNKGYISNGDGTHTVKCKLCNVILEEKAACAPYKYTVTNTTHTARCICGDELGTSEKHNWSNKDGKCAVCEYECEHKNGYTTSGSVKVAGNYENGLISLRRNIACATCKLVVAEYVNGTIVSEENVPGTCVEPAYKTYVVEWPEYKDSKGNVLTYTVKKGFFDNRFTGEIDPNNHVWGEVTYSWALVSKKWTCTATRTCTVHTDIVESVTSTSSRIEETIKGDCTKNEYTIEYYVAEFDVEWATNEFGSEDRYPAKAVSHSLAYKDNGDGTHKRYCKNGCTYYKETNSTHTYKNHKCSAKGCGAIEPTGWVETKGVWYYVYADYTKAKDIALVPYPKTAINGITYGPNQEDLDYAASHDKTFAFANEAYFLFKSDGSLLQITTTFISKGVEGFVRDGMIEWHPGYVEVNGETRYFVGDNTYGNKVANGIVYATRGLEGKYLFENGKIVDFTGVLDGLYFVNGKVAMGAGLVKLADGNIIYVRSAGQIATGSYWVTADKANGLVNGGRAYEFDENGYLVTEIAKTGIYDGKYYVEGKLTYAGLIEIDGDIYYINSKGEVVTGKYYVTKTNGMDLGTNKLYFGEDGKMLKIMNGIYEEEGKLYYYVGNRKQCGLGLVEIDGDLYYVRSSGELVTGYFFVTKTNEIEGFKTGDKCKFDKDGKLIQNFGPAKK